VGALGIPGKSVAKRGQIRIKNAISRELQKMDVVSIAGVAILVSMTQKSVWYVMKATGMNAVPIMIAKKGIYVTLRHIHAKKKSRNSPPA
jgi:hypothetical protein